MYIKIDHSVYLFFVGFLNIYLVVLGVSCSMWYLPYGMWGL